MYGGMGTQEQEGSLGLTWPGGIPRNIRDSSGITRGV